MPEFRHDVKHKTRYPTLESWSQWVQTTPRSRFLPRMWQNHTLQSTFWTSVTVSKLYSPIHPMENSLLGHYQASGRRSPKSMLVVGSGKMQRPSCVFSRFFQVVSISALPAYNYVHLPESRVDGHKLHRINLTSNRSFLLNVAALRDFFPHVASHDL